MPGPWLRLEDPSLRQKALEQILSRQLTVAQTDALVDQLLSPPPRTRTKRTFVVKDVRLFLNTLTRSMALMRSAGVDARCDRQDKDGEILLTIRIPQASVKMVSRETFSFPISPFLPIACRSQIAWRQARSRLSPSVCTSPLAAGRPCAVRPPFLATRPEKREKELKCVPSVDIIKLCGSLLYTRPPFRLRRRPMAKIIAIVNQKGGVGKTTTTVNLTAALAALGKRVLLCDFDPQANATSGMGVDKNTASPNVYDVLINGADPAAA